MKIYLSGAGWYESLAKNKDLLNKETAKDMNILTSFAYIKGEKTIKSLIPYFKSFMLDSGAFTFLSKGKNIDWHAYIDRYASFINEYDIDLFFELDIYSIVGIEETIRLRHELEKKTDKRCIPVWHRCLSKDMFFQMCNEYDYVALGGIAIKEIRQQEHKIFSWFINEAHKRNTKIHALGYTSIKGLNKYPFDSVDSSTWLMNGARYGAVWNFDGRHMTSRRKPANTRIITSKLVAHNFSEWVKYGIYMEG